jgi:Ca2+-binding RTX toxin-like protein
MKRLTSLGNGLKGLSAFSATLMLAATFGAAACTEDVTSDDAGVDPELGVNFDELGTPITNCTAATSTEFNSTTKVLNISVPDQTDAVVSVVGGKLKINGNQCQTSASPPVELTSTNVNRINITAVDNAKVVIDLLPGTFGNIFAGTGGVVVTGTTANLSVGVRGTPQANVVKMTEASSAYYLELSGDTRADLKIVPFTGSFPPVSLALGDGADSFSAQGQNSLTITALGSGTQADVNASQPLTVFGGVGNDTLKGGLGNDTLNGGEGNDLFQTNATTASVTADGADVYVGGAGTDTVDYSGRTVAVNVSVAPTMTNGWVKSTVSIFNASITDQQTLIFTGSGGAQTVTFGANDGNPVVGAAAILAAIGTPTGVNVTVGDRGELLVERDTAGAVTVAGTAATALFGAASVTNNGTTALLSDANDGLSGENDDVRNDVENLTGGTANDVLTGSTFANLINGGGGDDNISGGPGGTCSGAGSDTDSLNGGDGNDIFQMGFASNCSDLLDGGAGSDYANFEMRTAALTIDIDGAADDGESAELDNVKATIEGVLGGEGADIITGSAAADDLHGGLGADSLIGGAGNDSLNGGLGVDTLLGGTGEDYFNEKDTADGLYVKATNVSGTGGDLLNGGADFDKGDFARAATMTVTLCSSTNVTGAGACVGDTANADTQDGDDITNVEYFVGGAGADSIIGSAADDIIEGGASGDTITGGAGNDTLYGEAGSDLLDGEGGDDTLDGAAGTNTLVGGGGDDLCTLGAGGVKDVTCEI